MRKLVLKMSMSIDGFVGGPDGEVGWIFESNDIAAIAWTVETLSLAGVHIMGHRTYHHMAAWWPSSTEVFAPPMNEIPKVIFSRSGHITSPDVALTTTALKDVTARRDAEGGKVTNIAATVLDGWTHPRVMGTDLVNDIAKLKAEPGGFILAHGGAGFARSLIAANLVDEFRLLVHPVALGSGLSIFNGLSKPLRMTMSSETVFSGGTAAKVFAVG
jgi:dihydrofolate reductase